MAFGPLSPSAVERLYANYAAELRSFLTGLLRDRDGAAEALQSTFVIAAEQGHRARDESVRGWLFRVAYQQAMLLRRRKAVDERATRQSVWRVNRSSESPDVSAVRSETIERVRQGLEQLSDEQRAIVRLRIYEDKTFAEIAAELGLPLGTVVSRLRAAYQKLNAGLTSGTTDGEPDTV